MAEAIPITSDTESRPEGRSNKSWTEFWQKELESSQKMTRRFQREGMNAVNQFTDHDTGDNKSWFKLNIFNSTVNTMKAMMYGQTPETSITRQHDDPDDDVARVAALLLSRILNLDLAANGEEYDVVLRGVLEDRLIPGLGCARVRYDMETKTIDNEVWDEEEKEYIKEEQEVLDWEDAEIDYVYWGDVLWSWARNWKELRWVAFRSYLTKEKVEARFGKEWADKLTFRKTDPSANQKDDQFNRDLQDSVSTAEVWEIWDKESEQVFWFQLGQSDLCDKQDDPLELTGFFPVPPFMMANLTTTLFMPTSDWWLARKLYQHINILQTRIAVMSQALRVVGVYDQSIGELQRLMKEGSDNEMVPVQNWAAIVERGGLKGAMDFLPIKEVAETLLQVQAQRNDAINLLYQMTGMSDTIRGQSKPGQPISASENKDQTRFGSIRIQSLQDEYAKYCTDLMQLKAEIICKHYSPETIYEQANVPGMFPADQQIVPQAIALLKGGTDMYLRIVVKSESIAMADFAQKQAERTSFLEALGFFLQSSATITQEAPEATPFLLQMLKWGLAGFKGSQEIEGVLDQAIEQVLKNPPGQKQDPKAAEAAAKQHAAMQEINGRLQLLEKQGQLQEQKHQQDMREARLEHETKMREIIANHEAAMAELEARTRGKITEQAAQTEGDVVAAVVDTEAHIEKKQADNAVQKDE